MFFNSLHYVVFLALTMGVVALLRNKIRQRNLFLLAASYYFYSCWDWRFLSLIIISTIVDYACGLALNVQEVSKARVPRTRRERVILIISLATNLGILGFFKYFNFFQEGAEQLLRGIGFEPNPSTISFVLPVGISFYTFQTLSYTIDVYRGKLTTERSLLNFALFVAFFPQLVAGPIERASNLLPQLHVPSRITWTRMSSGFHLIAWGLFKKVVIADNVARMCNTIFALEPESPYLSAGVVMLGAYAFAIQIYCDFSGYSDIARGTARCMGFELMRNFNLPYFAANPAEVWQRWHISLSSWFRDYLYFPLGGSRGTGMRTDINVLVTFALSGLWHGAAWTFVVWGLFHWAFLTSHRFLGPVLARAVTPKSAFTDGLWKATKIFCCFNIFCLSWILFRADSLTQAWKMYCALVAHIDLNLNLSFISTSDLLGFSVCAIFLFSVQLAQHLSNDHYVVFRLPVPFRAVLYASLMLAFIIWGEFGGQSFIYFQF